MAKVQFLCKLLIRNLPDQSANCFEVSISQSCVKVPNHFDLFCYVNEQIIFYCVVIPFDGFLTNKYCCVCTYKDEHEYSNMAFSRKCWLLWMVTAVCIKTGFVWSQTENSCSEKCIFLLKSIVSKNISSNFLGCERHRSSFFSERAERYFI